MNELNPHPKAAMQRRQILQRLIVSAFSAPVALATAQTAQTTGFPTKPIRIVVGTLPGSAVDQAARMFADKMSEHLKQPVTVENMAGASSLLAIRYLLRAPADGYTLLVAANTLVTTQHVNPKAGYKLGDFAAIGEMVRSPMVLLVNAKSPFKTLPELVEAARQKPGEISYGSGGAGTTNHLPVELLAAQAGVKFTHVPYKSIAGAIPDINGGRVGFVMASPTSVAELIKGGALRALAISAAERSTAYPEVPTLREVGYPEATFEVWVGAVTAAGVPAAIRRRLADAIEVARASPDLAKRLQDLGQKVSPIRTPEQFETVLRRDEDTLRKVIKDAGIQTF